MRVGLAVLSVLAVVLVVGPAQAGVNSFWRELGGSASGNGISQLPSPGQAEAPAMAFGTDGLPIVVYAAYPGGASMAPGQITVKRWTGAAWQPLSGPGGIALGYRPQIKTAASGTLYVSWLQDDGDGVQVRLLRRLANGTAWQALGSSNSSGGLTMLNASVIEYSLAVGTDGSPIVAFETETQTGVLVDTDGILQGSTQIYVKRFAPTSANATTGTWQYLGSDPGTGGGASNAPSFSVDSGASFAQHSAANPSLAVTREGNPVVAFEYRTDYDGAAPTGFPIHSTQIFVAQWNGSAWVGMGPDVPQMDDEGPGRGGPGGASATDGVASQPALATRSGTTFTEIWLAWLQSGNDVFARRFDGASWVGVGGSDTPGGISNPAFVNHRPDVVVTSAFEPIVAWEGVDGVTSSQVFVKRGGVTFEEMGPDSAEGPGISDARLAATNVFLAAPPATGGPAVAWSNQVLDATGPFQVYVRQFSTAVPRALTVTLTGAGAGGGTVTSSPIGIDCPAECSALYPTGQVVTLTAVAGPGTLFDKWTGCTSVSGANCSVAMTAARNVSASFVVAAGLDVSRPGNGAGVVTGPGISCGPGSATDCTQAYPLGTPVILNATVPIGTIFEGWGGDCALRRTNSSCTLTMSDNRSVTALFTQTRHTLKVVSRTNGRVVDLDSLPDPIDCGDTGADCEATLDYGTKVRLQASPIAGSKFVSWAGCTSVVGIICSLTLTANRTVTPTYRDITSVGLTKTGQGTVTSAPGGISCGPACATAAFEFARGTRVTLTPTPVTGWDFVGWSGDPACPGRLCSFNASSATPVAVSASFSIQLKRLSVTVVGNGSVTGTGSVTGPGFVCATDTTPCVELFPYGNIETLTPLAAPGFKFTGWSQDCTGTSPITCKPTMTANHSVTATFKQVFGVTVTRQGNAAPTTGTITATNINCGPSTAKCAEDYLSGARITFSRSAPPAGRTFRWLGDCAFRGTSASCPLTIDANKSVIGEYALLPLGLTVNVSGPGTVTGLEGAVNCATVNCLSIVNYGTPVLLQPIPGTAPQGEFVGWSGCSTVVAGNCSFTLTANRTIVARFGPTVTSVEVKPATADDTVPLARGAARQYSAIATFSDASTQDVTARAIWTSSNLSVVTVIRTTGLVTGTGFGSATLTANFSTLRSMASGTSIVAADVLDTSTPLGPGGAVTVDCSPYGESGGSLSCLPAGRSFEVECRASARFAHRTGAFDVTDQATWSSTNSGIARSLGLADFGGPIVASFRIFTGIAAIRAALGGVVSSANVSPVNRWVVQGTPLAVTGVSVETPRDLPVVGPPLQLQAMATFAGVTTGVAGCPVPPALPPSRDFSLLTSWSSSNEAVADVNFFGLVTPVDSGITSVHWRYPGTTAAGAVKEGDVPINVVP